MSDIIDEAKKYWENNFNCSQAAACGILDFYGYKQQSETMLKALLPFGGGIGERSICGSLTGALAGLSTLLHEKGIDRDTIIMNLRDISPEIINQEIQVRIDGYKGQPGCSKNQVKITLAG